MFCLKLSHYRELEVLKSKVEIAADRYAALDEKVKERDLKIEALLEERKELMHAIVELQQHISSISGSREVGSMPLQARDWKHIADEMSAKADLNKMRG